MANTSPEPTERAATVLRAASAAPETGKSDSALTDAELHHYLSGYYPKGVPASVWDRLRPDAIDLVLKSGSRTRPMARVDLQLLGSVADYLHGWGRPVTLREALSDVSLLGFDQHQQHHGVANSTRRRRRSQLRRLQATFHGVPWRKPRRRDGDRVASLPGPEVVAQIAQIELSAAQEDSPGARALITALEAARARPRFDPAAAWIDDATWRTARRYADRHDQPITKRMVTAAVAHAALAELAPLAVLIPRHKLTRRDLDLGLTHVLQNGLTDAEAVALRGV